MTGQRTRTLLLVFAPLVLAACAAKTPGRPTACECCLPPGANAPAPPNTSGESDHVHRR